MVYWGLRGAQLFSTVSYGIFHEDFKTVFKKGAKRANISKNEVLYDKNHIHSFNNMVFG